MTDGGGNAPAAPRRSRERILADIDAAAIEIFAREGLSGASTQSIAARAGISKQRLHYYIPSKEALYEKVLRDVMGDWIRGFGRPDSHLGPREALASYIRRKMEFSFEQPLRSRIFAMEIMRGAPVLRPMMRASKKRTAEAVTVLREWIAQGRMDPVDPLWLLFHIWAVTQFYAEHAEQVRYFTGRRSLSRSTREEIIQQTTALVLRGVGAR